MTKKVSDTLKVSKDKKNKENLGNAIQKWISESKNLSSLKIKMKFGEKGGKSDKKKRSVHHGPASKKERYI